MFPHNQAKVELRTQTSPQKIIVSTYTSCIQARIDERLGSFKTRTGLRHVLYDEVGDRLCNVCYIINPSFNCSACYLILSLG